MLDRRDLTVALQKLSHLPQQARFRKTAEPAGDVKVAPAKQRRFVIQKHDATRLHYDLRLELDGVFKSWAVTGGPRSIRRTSGWRLRSRITRSITAISKAPFPKASMAVARCMLWDRGYWESDDPERGFKKGDLKFTLRRRQAARQLGAGADEGRPQRRQAHQLAPDQAPRRVRQRGQGDDILERIAPWRRAARWTEIAEARARRQNRSCCVKAAKADAVWHPTGATRPRRANLRKKAACGLRRKRKRGRRRQAQSPRRSRRCPISSRRNSARSVERPPGGDGWVP